MTFFEILEMKKSYVFHRLKNYDVFQTPYFTKLFMFADQLGLGEELRALLRRMVLCLMLVNAPAWVAYPAAADVPVVDLVLQ